MYVIRPPPWALALSSLSGENSVMFGVFWCGCNLFFWMSVMCMLFVCMKCLSCWYVFCRPSVLYWSMLML
jgi:hypothetical protein